MSAPLSPISHPMRAVLLVMFAWVDLRAAMMLPDGSEMVTSPAPMSVAGGNDISDTVALPTGALAAGRGQLVLASGLHGQRDFAKKNLRTPQRSSRYGGGWNVVAESVEAAIGEDGPVGLPNAAASGHAHPLSGSAWFLARGDGGGGALANGGQLGGSQAGIRLFYQTAIPFLALTARASMPLASRLGREATIGIALRKHGMGLILEQRLALDRSGRTAPSVTAYGGVSDIALGNGVRLDGYLQGGAVGIRHVAGFVDGAMRLEHTLMEQGTSRLSGGLALSGGAQPGVRRVDVGPQIVARVPVDGTPVRVSAEWRQRIAGNAAPGSGPAVTVGVDF